MSFKSFRGTNRRWGVSDGGVLYEPGFCKRTADRIAQLNNQEPRPRDWLHTEELLKKEGYDATYRE